MRMELARRLFPDIDAEDTEQWMGSRPSFPDSLPRIGPIPCRSDLFAAFGHSQYGFGMAPATGRIIASIVRGPVSFGRGTPNLDRKPYRMERFG